MRRSQAVVVLLVSLIAWQGLMAATSAMSQDRPAGFQDILRKGDVASLAAVIDKDPSLANRLDAQGVPPLFWAAFYGQKAVVELLLGRGTPPESLGREVHSEFREFDPFIAPGESYVIFASTRPGGLGGPDLYISFRNARGEWDEPKNMGPSVNSAASDYTPILSPDGRSLFFTSSREGQDDIFWIDAGVIAALRPPAEPTVKKPQAASSSAARQPVPPSRDSAVVEQAIRDSIGWALTKDRALLERIMAHDADLFMFNPDSKSTIVGWDGFVKNFAFWMDPRFKATSFDVRELRTTFSRSGDVAWFSAILDDLAEWDGTWVIVQMHFSFASDKVRADPIVAPRHKQGSMRPRRSPGSIHSGLLPSPRRAVLDEVIQLHAVLYAEFPVDVVDVFLDRFGRDEQAARDLLVGVALHQQFDDLDLSRRDSKRRQQFGVVHVGRCWRPFARLPVEESAEHHERRDVQSDLERGQHVVVRVDPKRCQHVAEHQVEHEKPADERVDHATHAVSFEPVIHPAGSNQRQNHPPVRGGVLEQESHDGHGDAQFPPSRRPRLGANHDQDDGQAAGCDVGRPVDLRRRAPDDLSQERRQEIQRRSRRHDRQRHAGHAGEILRRRWQEGRDEHVPHDGQQDENAPGSDVECPSGKVGVSVPDPQTVRGADDQEADGRDGEEVGDGSRAHQPFLSESAATTKVEKRRLPLLWQKLRSGDGVY